MMGPAKSRVLRLLETLLVATLPTLRPRVRTTLRVKALLVKPDRLGDLALTAPLIQSLIARLGADQVALVVSEVNADLARRIFPGVHLAQIPLYLPAGRPAAWLAALGAVAHIEAEDAFLLRHTWRPPHLKAIWRSLRARRRHWIRSAADIPAPGPVEAKLLGGQPLDHTAVPTPGHAFDAELSNALFAAAYGAPLPATRVPSPAFAGPIPPELGDRILMFPFSSEAIRDLPPAMVTGIIGHLAKTHGIRVLLCGLTSRADELRALCTHVADHHPDLGSLAPLPWSPPSFDAFYHAITAARAIVSTDTGPAHLAIIHDRPFFGLAGGGQFGVFVPWALTPRQRWIWHELPCYGCNWHCKFERPHCITDIPLPAITAGLDAWLGPLTGAGR